MSGTRAFASLAPRLLARKGAARPAMRPAGDAGLTEFEALAASQSALGWDDMGDSALPDPIPAPAPAPVPVAVAAAASCEQGSVTRVDFGARPRPARGAVAKARKAARDAGRAAFTLRLDPERHLKLRLASTIEGSSAQALVTEALDRFFAEMPQLENLAGQLAPAMPKS